MKKRFTRRTVAIFSGVILLALVSGAVLRFLATRASPPHAPPSQITIDPAKFGLACLIDVSWSPDGSKLALLGTERGCNEPQSGASTYNPTLLVIMDPASGASLSEIQPDTSAEQALKLAGVPAHQMIEYSGLAWSPNGKRLAMPFTVTYEVSSGGTSESSPGVMTIVAGIALANSDGSDARAFAISSADTRRFTGEWNVKTGRPFLYSTVPSNQVMIVGSYTLPAYLHFTWGADGALAGTGLLNSASAPAPEPLGPVGSPDGAASFTVWQWMQVGQNTGDPVHPVSPAPFVADSSFTAWSPDGAYLMSVFAGPWRVQPSKQPVPGPAELKATFSAKIPVLPLRDAAFDAAMNSIDPSATVGDTLSLAWSPNGRMLSDFTSGAAGAPKVNIRDCASGRVITTITLRGSSNATDTLPDGVMRWSPNGKWLLINASGALHLIGGAGLPHV